METKSERLSLAFSEGGAQEIYQEIKSNGDFLGFAQRYAFDSDYRVARSALWGLTKAKGNELSELQAILNELIDQAIQSENSSVRRLTLNIIERLKIDEDDLRTDFLDFCFERTHGQHRGVLRHPNALHETCFSYVHFLSGTDGRVETHP